MEFVLLITAFNLFGAVRGFSYGAPDAFCQYQNLQDRNVKLVPGHTGVEPMNSRVPNRYQIVVGPENRNGQRRGKYPALYKSRCTCRVLGCT